MASVQSYIRAEVSHGVFPTPQGAEAFSAYAIASGKGLVPEMENTARQTLDHPMTFEVLGEGLHCSRGGHYATLPASASVIETISSHASSHFSKLKNCNSKSGLLVPLILSIPADHTIDTEAIVIQIHIRYQNFPCSTRINPCRLGWHNFSKTSR